jgi:hypothetical protein
MFGEEPQVELKYQSKMRNKDKAIMEQSTTEQER